MLFAVVAPVGVGVQQPVVDRLAEPAELQRAGLVHQQPLVLGHQRFGAGIAGGGQATNVSGADLPGRQRLPGHRKILHQPTQPHPAGALVLGGVGAGGQPDGRRLGPISGEHPPHVEGSQQAGFARREDVAELVQYDGGVREFLVGEVVGINRYQLFDSHGQRIEHQFVW